MSCVHLTETVSSRRTKKLSHVHSFALTLHDYAYQNIPASSMAASNRIDPNDAPQHNALPSIESLFGLKREDDLDLLLPIGDPNRRASETDRRKPPSLSLHPTSRSSRGSFSLVDLDQSLPRPSFGDDGEDSRSSVVETALSGQNSLPSPDTPAYDAASDVIHPKIPNHTFTPPLTSFVSSPSTPGLAFTTPPASYSSASGSRTTEKIIYPQGLPGGSSRGRSYSDTGESDGGRVVSSGFSTGERYQTQQPSHHRHHLAALSISSYAPHSHRSRYGSTVTSQEPGIAPPPPPPAFSRHLSLLSPDSSSKRRHTISAGRAGRLAMEEDRIHKPPPRLPPLSSTSQAHLDRQLQSQSHYAMGPTPSPSSIGPSSSSSSEVSFRIPASATSSQNVSFPGTSPIPPSPSSLSSRHRPHHLETHAAGQSGRPSTSPSPFHTLPPSSFPRRLSTAGAYPTSASTSSPSGPLQHNPAQVRPISSSSSSPFAFSPGSYHRPSSSHGLTRRTSASSSSDYGQTTTPMTTYSGRPNSGVSIEGSLSGYEDDGYGVTSGHSSLHDSHSEDVGLIPTGGTSRPATAGSAKYECEYCRKRFNRPSSLKIHVNTHTGEKPFKCPFPGCGRRFSVSSNMRRHSRVHNQPKSNLSSSANPFASAPPTFSLNQADDGMDLDDEDDENDADEDTRSSPKQDSIDGVDRKFASRSRLSSPPPTSFKEGLYDTSPHKRHGGTTDPSPSVDDNAIPVTRSPRSDRSFRDVFSGGRRVKRRSVAEEDSDIDDDTTDADSSRRTRGTRKRSKSKAETSLNDKTN